MTRSEINIEPSDKGVDEIVATAVQHEGGGEGEVGSGAGVEVEG